MDLITGCHVPLAPSRIQAIAECSAPQYLGDTELMAFLRCLGDKPNCEQLARCSGPIVQVTPDGGHAAGAEPGPAGAATAATGAAPEGGTPK